MEKNESEFDNKTQTYSTVTPLGFKVPELGLAEVAAAAEPAAVLERRDRNSTEIQKNTSTRELATEKLVEPLDNVVSESIEPDTDPGADPAAEPTSQSQQVAENCCGWKGCGQECGSLAGLVGHLQSHVTYVLAFSL